MSTVTPRLRVPATAARGDVIEIKTLITHEMESGQRRDREGNVIPRRIVNSFTCEFNGRPVFSCSIQPAVSANPYLAFTAKLPESGTLVFTWVDDDGSTYRAERAITIT
jgi:sulfur-oxidizing protein SoxZ